MDSKKKNTKDCVEVDIESRDKVQNTKDGKLKTKPNWKLIIAITGIIVIMALIIGLSVGLTQRNAKKRKGTMTKKPDVIVKLRLPLGDYTMIETEDKKRAFLKECNTIFNPEKIGCVDATKGSIVIYLKDGTKKLSVSDLEKKVEDKIKTVEEIDGHSTKFTHNYNHAEPEGVQEYLDELQKAKDAADKLQKEKDAADKLQKEKDAADKLQKEKEAFEKDQLRDRYKAYCYVKDGKCTKIQNVSENLVCIFDPSDMTCRAVEKESDELKQMMIDNAAFKKKAEDLKQKGKKLQEDLEYANQDQENIEDIERLKAEIEQNELEQQQLLEDFIAHAGDRLMHNEFETYFNNLTQDELEMLQDRGTTLEELKEIFRARKRKYMKKKVNQDVSKVKEREKERKQKRTYVQSENDKKLKEAKKAGKKKANQNQETKEFKDFEAKAEGLKQKGKKLQEDLDYAEFYNQDQYNIEAIDRLTDEIKQNELDQQQLIEDFVAHQSIDRVTHSAFGKWFRKQVDAQVKLQQENAKKKEREAMKAQLRARSKNVNATKEQDTYEPAKTLKRRNSEPQKVGVSEETIKKWQKEQEEKEEAKRQDEVKRTWNIYRQKYDAKEDNKSTVASMKQFANETKAQRKKVAEEQQLQKEKEEKEALEKWQKEQELQKEQEEKEEAKRQDEVTRTWNIYRQKYDAKEDNKSTVAYMKEFAKAKRVKDAEEEAKRVKDAEEELQQEKQQREKEETDKLQKEKDDQEAADKLKQEKQQREKEETDKLQKEKDDQEAADKLQQEKQQREKEETDKLQKEKDDQEAADKNLKKNVKDYFEHGLYAKVIPQSNSEAPQYSDNQNEKILSDTSETGSIHSGTSQITDEEKDPKVAILQAEIIKLWNDKEKAKLVKNDKEVNRLRNKIKSTKKDIRDIKKAVKNFGENIVNTNKGNGENNDIDDNRKM